MKLNLYFTQDKVVGLGGVIVPKTDILPEQVYSGIDVLRTYDDDHYKVSLNSCIEQEVFKIYNAGRPGTHSKIYNLVDSRELAAYDMLIGRLIDEKALDKAPVNYYFLWKDIFTNGVYTQMAGTENIVLDKVIYDGMLEYDNNGYYSISHLFIDRIKEKKTYPINKAMEIIKCPDTETAIMFFENIGYKWKSGKLSSGKNNDILFFEQ